MASFALHFSLLTLAILSFSRLSHSQDKPKLLTLPIVKDPTTNLFYTSVGIGIPQDKFDLVIDIGAPFLWYDCYHQYNSSTFNFLSCDSKLCLGDMLDAVTAMSLCNPVAETTLVVLRYLAIS